MHVEQSVLSCQQENKKISQNIVQINFSQFDSIYVVTNTCEFKKHSCEELLTTCKDKKLQYFYP